MERGEYLQHLRMKNRLIQEERTTLRLASMPKLMKNTAPVREVKTHDEVMGKVLGEIRAVLGGRA